MFGLSFAGLWRWAILRARLRLSSAIIFLRRRLMGVLGCRGEREARVSMWLLAVKTLSRCRLCACVL